MNLQRLLRKTEIRAKRNKNKKLAGDLAYLQHWIRAQGGEDSSEEEGRDVAKEAKQKLVDSLFGSAKKILKEKGAKFDYRDLFVLVYNTVDLILQKHVEF